MMLRSRISKKRMASGNFRWPQLVFIRFGTQFASARNSRRCSERLACRRSPDGLVEFCRFRLASHGFIRSCDLELRRLRLRIAIPEFPLRDFLRLLVDTQGCGATPAFEEKIAKIRQRLGSVGAMTFFENRNRAAIQRLRL